MKNSDLRGLEQDLNREIKHNRKRGGPTDVMKKEAKKQGVKLKYSGVREKRRDGYVFIGDVVSEKWETELPKDLKRDKEYLAIKKELAELNPKDWKTRFELISKLNERYDKLKEKRVQSK